MTSHASEPPKRLNFRIEPIHPDSTTDIRAVAELFHAAFDGDNSDFVRRIHVSPLPPSQVRTAALTTQLAYALKHVGKIGFKAVVDDPKGEKDGEMAGIAIWQPPGVRLKVFPSTKREDLPDHLKEMYEPNDLEAWNAVYGGMQEKRDKLQGDKDHWYLEVLAIHPSYQRQGIGHALLDARFSEIGDLPVQLESTPAGKGLYQKYGFELVDELKVLLEPKEAGKTIDFPIMVRNKRG